MREPASRRELLPVLLNHHRGRALPVAARRPVHPRDDQQLRRKLRGRVRPAAPAGLPAIPQQDDNPRAHLPLQQLPQHSQLESLPPLTTHHPPAPPSPPPPPLPPAGAP